MCHVAGQSLPQQKQHLSIAVISRDAGSPEFHRVLQNAGWEMRQIKFGCRVEPSCSGCHLTGLHSIGTNYPAGIGVFDDQVMADVIKLVQIARHQIRRLESFAKLQIEDLESKLQYSIQFFACASETDVVTAFKYFLLWYGLSEYRVTRRLDNR